MRITNICSVCQSKKHHQAIICRKCHDDNRKKISKSRLGLPCIDCKQPVKDFFSKRCFKCSLNYRRGSDNPNWKGGINPEIKKDRTSEKYIEWRRLVFERDNYICTFCKNNIGGNLVAHHILSFKRFKNMRFNVGNGITLCNICHIKLHQRKDTFWIADRWFWGAQING